MFRRIRSLGVVLGLVLAVGVTPIGAASAIAHAASPTRKWIPTATLVVPRLNLSMPIYSGITMDVFDRGIGQWPGTPSAGQPGNMVLGGHRTSGKHPFYYIERLASGDQIQVISKGVTYTYVVTGHRIVKPTATWIINQTPDATLTMFACNPRGKVTERYVVSAVLQQQ